MHSYNFLKMNPTTTTTTETRVKMSLPISKIYNTAFGRH